MRRSSIFVRGLFSGIAVAVALGGVALFTVVAVRRSKERRRLTEEKRPFIDGVGEIDEAAVVAQAPPEVSSCIPRLLSEAPDASSADESWW